MRFYNMKLIVLIPAYNEESNIEKAILNIPRKNHGHRRSKSSGCQ